MPRRNYIQKTTGRKVHGVTTQMGILAKPALLWWAYKQGNENYERLSGIVAKILSKSDIMDGPLRAVIEEALTDFQPQALYDKRDEAGNAGTLSHDFVENHLRKMSLPKLDGIPEGVAGKAKGCYKTFLAWEKSQKLKVIDSEVELTSELTPTGGTIDHVIKTALTKQYKAAVEILDLKTGKDIYLEAKIQVAKYKRLWEEKYPKRPVKGLHILRLGPNGEFTHKFFPELDKYDLIYDHCSAIFYLIKELGERQ